jgi:hypothetical protein
MDEKTRHILISSKLMISQVDDCIATLNGRKGTVSGDKVDNKSSFRSL